MLRKYKEIILKMYREIDVRVGERRKKRMVIPIIYFMAEVVLVWLIFTLIEMNFNVAEWNVLSILVFVTAVLYSTFKTVHVYRRQREYSNNNEIAE